MSRHASNILELESPAGHARRAAVQDGLTLARSVSARRWAIWQEQEAAGQQACFATPLRLVCTKVDCLWRSECLKLRADWMR